MTVQKPTIKGEKVGGGPISGNPHHLPQVVGIIVTLSLWSYPAPKNESYFSASETAPNSVCGVCFFLGYSRFPRWHCALESLSPFETDLILPKECYITPGHAESPIVFCAYYQGKGNEEGNSVFPNCASHRYMWLKQKNLLLVPLAAGLAYFILHRYVLIQGEDVFTTWEMWKAAMF